MIERTGRQLAKIAAVRVDRPNVVVPVSIRLERQTCAVGRPGRLAVVAETVSDRSGVAATAGQHEKRPLEVNGQRGAVGCTREGEIGALGYGEVYRVELFRTSKGGDDRRPREQK